MNMIKIEDEHIPCEIFLSYWVCAIGLKMQKLCAPYSIMKQLVTFQDIELYFGFLLVHFDEILYFW